MNKDLTAGKPEKVLWQFCLPLFGSIIFQQLYNIADSFVAGKPTVEGAYVTAKVLGNGKSKKIYIMKYKSKKNEKKKIGHRQPYTKVQIEKIYG